MFKKLSLQNRLFLSVAILAAALVAEAIVGLQVSKKMSDNLQELYSTSAPLNKLKKISDAYVVGVAGAVQKTRAGGSWEDGRQLLEDSLKTIDANWTSYAADAENNKDASKEEKTVLLVVKATLHNNNYFFMQLREAFEQKDVKSLEILATSNLYPVIDPIVEQMDKLVDLKWKNSQKLIDDAQKSYNASFLFMILLGIISLGLGIGIILIVAIGVSGKFKSIAEQLVQSADQVSNVSEKVSGASVQQAKGVAESALNLQQTSESLTSMAAMTGKNADGATRASRLMDQTQATMIKSNQSMDNTLNAMKTVNESAEKISRIVKSIEEIALQTNILSLNASVEAARAGEHGKGFAVVAEEVRSLAQRCALAAKETSQMIEDNARRASSGMDVTETLGAALREMIDQTHRVATLLNEIETTSQLQTQGISEIGFKMGKLQEVTQNNNLNAKDTATASEDMARQASGLKAIVKQLVTIVDGEVEETKEDKLASEKKEVRPFSWARFLRKGGAKGPAVKPGSAPTLPNKAVVH